MGVLCPGPLHQGRRQWLPGGLASVVPSVSGRLPNQRSLQKCCLVAGGRGRWPCSESRTWHPQAVEQCECPWEFRGLQGEPARWGSPDALHPDGHEGEGATPVQVTDIPRISVRGLSGPWSPPVSPAHPEAPGAHCLSAWAFAAGRAQGDQTPAGPEAALATNTPRAAQGHAQRGPGLPSLGQWYPIACTLAGDGCPLADRVIWRGRVRFGAT